MRREGEGETGLHISVSEKTCGHLSVFVLGTALRKAALIVIQTMRKAVQPNTQDHRESYSHSPRILPIDHVLKLACPQYLELTRKEAAAFSVVALPHKAGLAAPNASRVLLKFVL